MKASDPPHGLLQRIMLRLALPITVRVSPRTFTFISKTGAIEIETYLYLKDTARGLRVLAVGEDLPEQTPAVFRLDLFEEDRSSRNSPGDVDRTECLEAFVRYGIQKLHGRRTMIRPLITATGVESLDTVFHGYQRGILREVFQRAGAATVSFE
jgi:hypothetical protein